MRKKIFKIIIEGEGIFLKKKFDLIESITKVDGISFLNSVEQDVSMNIKKLDIKLTKMAWMFYNIIENINIESMPNEVYFDGLTLSYIRKLKTNKYSREYL